MNDKLDLLLKMAGMEYGIDYYKNFNSKLKWKNQIHVPCDNADKMKEVMEIARIAGCQFRMKTRYKYALHPFFEDYKQGISKWNIIYDCEYIESETMRIAIIKY